MPFDSNQFAPKVTEPDLMDELSPLSLDELKNRYTALEKEAKETLDEMTLRQVIGNKEGLEKMVHAGRERKLVEEMATIKGLIGEKELKAEEEDENAAEWTNMRTENMNMETHRQREAQRPFAEKITESAKTTRDLQIARKKADEISFAAQEIANRDALKKAALPENQTKTRELELRGREARLVAQIAEAKWYEFGKKSGLQKALATTRESLAPFEQAKQQMVRAKQQKARQIIGETLSTISPPIANQPIERKQGGSTSWREFITKWTPFLPQYDVANRGRGGLMRKPVLNRDVRTAQTELKQDARENRRTGT